MKFFKNILIYTLVFVGLLILSPKVTLAESIPLFSGIYQINTDSSVSVSESIDYDFGTEYKHGIYRNIKVEGIKIKPQEITLNDGTDYPYTTSLSGGVFTFKIGSPNKTITGRNIYGLRYLAQNALRYFSDQDQFYFNVTGNGWTVPIEKSTATVFLPEGISKSAIQLACYTGIYGSKDKNCIVSLNEDGNAFFETTQPLTAGEGLTIVVGWPKGFVKVANNYFELGDTVKYFILSIGLFLFLATILEGVFNWSQKGRDASPSIIIVPQYEPPTGFTPAEMLYLMYPMNYGNYISKAMGATLIDLAYNGYINIKELPKSWWQKQDYLISENDKTKTRKRISKKFEDDFMEYLFSFGESSQTMIRQVKMSQVGKIQTLNKFPRELEEKITQSETIKPYFEILPKEIIKISQVPIRLAIITGLYWIMFSLILSKTFETMLGFMVPIILCLSILSVLYGKLMIKRNFKGLEGYEKCLGFKKYLAVAEKDILAFQAKMKELDYKNIFEKYLPYAIALGVVKEWGKAFDGLITEPIDWWQTSSGVYNYAVFTRSLNSFYSSIEQNSATSSSSGFSSGGGFSGGGGGGGGGGSW